MPRRLPGDPVMVLAERSVFAGTKCKTGFCTGELSFMSSFNAEFRSRRSGIDLHK